MADGRYTWRWAEEVEQAKRSLIWVVGMLRVPALAPATCNNWLPLLFTVFGRVDVLATEGHRSRIGHLRLLLELVIEGKIGQILVIRSPRRLVRRTRLVGWIAVVGGSGW